MANLITILRSIFVFIVVIILFAGKGSNIAYFSAFVLTIITIVMDGLDGYIARKYNLSSRVGALLDIIGDRIVENIYWVTFLALGWIPLWIPLVVLTRGIVVDGIRSVAMEQGYTAFGKTTMMKSSIGKFLVASNFSRGSYAAFKGIAFSMIILYHLPFWGSGTPLETIHTISFYMAYISVYIAVFFCVIRGLPVIIESRYLFEKKNETDLPRTEQQKSTKSGSPAKEVSSIH